MGFFMLAVASSQAPAQTVPASFDLAKARNAAVVGAGAQALGTVAAPALATVTSAVTTANGSVVQAAPAQAVKLSLAPEIAKEAAWLHRNGWPLYALVDRYSSSAEPLNTQENCIAVAVYHEARGESLEGQLAVARVIMNRAASGKYPPSWCDTVKQPWQFSFVNPRTGALPFTDTASASWRKAVAITKLAVSDVVPTLTNDVLWYHATYVAPSWGRRLSVAQRIGTHIFYRS